MSIIIHVIKLLILYIQFIQYVHSDTFNYSVNLNENNDYTFEWSVNLHNNEKWLHFNVCLNLPHINEVNKMKTISYLKVFGIGFGRKLEPMNLDVYMLYFPLRRNNKLHDKPNYLFIEAYTDEYSMLHLRDSIDSQLYGVSYPEPWEIHRNHQSICFNFGRMAISCRENGYSINNQTTHLFIFHSFYDEFNKYDTIYQLWLQRIGLTPFNLLNNLNMKKISYQKLLLQLIKSSLYTNLMITNDIQMIPLHVHKVELPAVETTYWCTTIELPYFLQPHHIVRYENDIEVTSQGLIHHMEVFRCPGHNIRYYNAPCNSETKPDDLIDCREVIAAWAVGSTGLTFPAEAGIPIGGSRGQEYAVIEIHYNNPNNMTGIIDNSGFRLYITNKLRKHNVGIMELGLVYTPNNFIPPKQTNFTLAGYCDSQCTDVSLPHPNGIFVFASQLHTHMTGVKVVTYHLRNGTQLPDLNRDNNYSPHFQEIRQLDQQVQIRPGDSLITVCTYDTSKKHQVTFGGIGKTDEMCLNYIFYYPKIELELCKSDVSFDALSVFLNTLSTNENQQNHDNIKDRVNNVTWNEKNIEYLGRFYRNAPIEMHCNSSSGIRIKNSKIYRFPETIPSDNDDENEIHNENCSSVSYKFW
ncbi:hypothetical protein MN116_002442 [Schistosoma mekongi]|uniref:Dopamine beta-hydroxylase n=1 Tax=Schistosoma mekongi TaxID=38744 RepID=A0AAE1ZJN9_SCHME|nr:hypothetical protein MN116_002442 [Schistosoma mekongi]